MGDLVTADGKIPCDGKIPECGNVLRFAYTPTVEWGPARKQRSPLDGIGVETAEKFLPTHILKREGIFLSTATRMKRPL